MADSKNTPPGAWDWITNALTAKEIVTLLFSVGGGSTVAVWVSRKMFPQAWEHQDKIFASVAVFCFAALASWSALSGFRALAPRVQEWIRERREDPPKLTLKPYSGQTAVIQVTNEGGAALLTAMGKILSVSNNKHFREDPYFPLWRNDQYNRLYLTPPNGLLLHRGQSVTLAVAQYALDNIAHVLAVVGNDHQVERHTWPRPYDVDSPKIKLVIALSAKRMQTIARQYELYVPAAQIVVSIKDVTP